MSFQGKQPFFKFLQSTATGAALGEAAPSENYILDERLADQRENEFLSFSGFGTTAPSTSADWFQQHTNYTKVHVSRVGRPARTLAVTFAAENHKAHLLVASQDVIRIETIEGLCGRASWELSAAAARDLIQEMLDARKVSQPVPAAVEARLKKWLKKIDSASDSRPAFVAPFAEVELLLERPDWANRIRDALGLGHIRATTAGSTTVVLLQYSLDRVRVAHLGAPAWTASPTVLDDVAQAGPNPHFFPSPEAGSNGYGFTVDLDVADASWKRELVHAPIAFELKRHQMDRSRVHRRYNHSGRRGTQTASFAASERSAALSRRATPSMNAEITKWLTDFEAAPVDALRALVLGRTPVAAWSRSSFREIFLEIRQTHSTTLDIALTAWLAKSIFEPAPDRTPDEVWASHLQDIFRAATGVPLPNFERLLRDQLRDFRSWLRPFRYAESCDPEASYLAALAWSTTNHGLEGLWQSLTLRKNREPIYYSDIGLLGLCKSRDDHGALPSKAPFLLLATLLDLADVPGTSHDYWELTTRALLASYHWSTETWVREFEPILDARPEARNGSKWLKRILPMSVTKKRNHESKTGSAFDSRKPPHTLAECNQIVEDIRERGPAALSDRITAFLNRNRAYASSMNNPYYLVRTFNRLAEAARGHDAKWAVTRAEEALEWDEQNVRNWTVLARCLWARGIEAEKADRAGDAEDDMREALDTLWTARFRFPYNAYVRTELARLHREAGNLEMAEAIYNEAIAEFPRNAVCRAGLAEALAEDGKYADAEAVFKQAMEAIPEIPASANGLANMWVSRGAVDKAERLYRDTREKFPADPYCRTGLADILFNRSARNRDEVEREEARALLKEAIDLRNRFAVWRLQTFDERWEKLVGRDDSLRQKLTHNERLIAAPLEPDDMRPAQRLGRALLLQWRAARPKSPDEREHLLIEAEQLLSLPLSAAGECRTAFIEARGFLLLARGKVKEALGYFEVKLAEAAPRIPLGLRLGLIEARANLGEPLGEDEEVELEAFGKGHSILPLVLKVIRLLEVSDSDSELRQALLDLYPRVHELLGMPLSEIGEEDLGEGQFQPMSLKEESPDEMLAQWVQTRIFDVAAIRSNQDLKLADRLEAARESARQFRPDALSALEKLALAA